MRRLSVEVREADFDVASNPERAKRSMAADKIRLRVCRRWRSREEGASDVAGSDMRFTIHLDSEIVYAGPRCQ